MPIFEYKCNNCNSTFELLTKASSNSEEIVCPQCRSSNNKKLFSAFSTSVSSSSYSGDSCSSGNCGLDSPGLGGCASGMCGLN